MIKELLEMNTFTQSEKTIIEYIETHPECINHYNAKELSQLMHVSSPTIIRFVKKLGFKGYLDFQKAYIQESILNEKMNDIQISSQSNIDDIINILPLIYENIFYQTQKNIKKEPFVRTINYMLQADQIDFYANDNNYSEVQSACLKLNTLGIRAQAFNTLSQQYADSINPQKVLSFVVSHTGKNQTMVNAAYYLRKKRARVIAITGKLDPTLELICNESLYIDSSSHQLASGMMLYGLSIHYILDILIASIIVKKGKI